MEIAETLGFQVEEIVRSGKPVRYAQIQAPLFEERGETVRVEVETEGIWSECGWNGNEGRDAAEICSLE